MNLNSVPWLEMSILVAAVGAIFVSRLRDPNRAYRWGLVFTGTSFVCTALASLGFYLHVLPEQSWAYNLQSYLWGHRVLGLDDLNAPLLPAVALLHFLTALATQRRNMRRFSFSWSLAAEVICLATFSCKDSWALVGLLAASTVPPYVELVNRNRPKRVYVLHMGLFVGLLVAGWAAVRSGGSASPPATWALLLLTAAVLVRCAVVPAHCWLTDWFEHASLGIALLFVAPLSGVYAAVRLVLPISPDWLLRAIGIAALITALYAAGMAAVQREIRRFFAFLLISYTSLVLVGVVLHTVISVTGALGLWFAVILSLGGFGLTLRALEARFGRLSLADYHGLYEHSPILAVCFLLTGLATVGFPGTSGFISSELLVDGAVEADPYVGIAVVAVGAINGISVLRAYFLLFTGARHASTVELGLGRRERVAVLTLAALILLGGLYPQPGVSSRHRAAEAILGDRIGRSHLAAEPPPPKREIAKAPR